MDHNTLFADVLIGAAELELGAIYTLPGHELHNAWCARKRSRAPPPPQPLAQTE
jgi:hypothetical protein